jgi:hypothetical protein
LDLSRYSEEFPAFMKNTYVDILHSRPLEIRDELEVVILQGIHQGKWVRCSAIRSATDHIPEKLKPWCNYLNRYTIFVWETIHYDHAIGFSGSPATGISRQHLRRVIKPENECVSLLLEEEDLKFDTEPV